MRKAASPASAAQQARTRQNGADECIYAALIVADLHPEKGLDF
jgi:hypothetical protein